MTSAQLINQTSGDVEIYTPDQIIDAARQTFGGWIDLDPASCEVANKRVRAIRFFTKEDDGLRQPWFGNVWVNHPFGREFNKKWIGKMVSEFEDRPEVKAICCITFASTSEEWFRPLLDYPQCFLWPRTNYLRPDGSIYRGVTKGSVVTYFGRNLEAFKKAFSGLGTVKV